MALFFELCRLCLTNCSSNCNGVIIYENDEVRRQKIKDCLSIIIPDIFQICSNCDSKLSCFYQFRLDSIRCQHEFNDHLKSVQPPQNVPYEQEYYIPMNEQNMYSQHPAQSNEIQEDYHAIYMAHELHLALEDNQNDNNSLISMPTNNEHIYEQMQTPTATHHHIHSEEVDQPPQTIENQQQELIEDPKIESAPICEESIDQQIENQPENILQNDDFTYDDFDDSCQSFPNDRNNIDNAIDKKIEEFIQNKRNKANPKICTVCNKLFRTNYKLREHMRTHENNPKFICDYLDCNKSFKSKIGLKEHTAAKHTGQYSYACELCDKKFLLRSYYLAHQKIHSNAKNFACTMCSKTFKNKQNLVNHENFHYGLKLFTCEICQKSFTTKTNLDVHVKSHTQIVQFECDVCKKYFKTRAYLKVHKKTHYKELQNYSCKTCSKTFIQLCDLKIHVKTHTNQKDFVCEICGESFTRKDSLKLHVSSVHNKDCVFVCEFCQKTFTRKYSLNQHRKKCINSTSAHVSTSCEILE